MSYWHKVFRTLIYAFSRLRLDNPCIVKKKGLGFGLDGENRAPITIPQLAPKFSTLSTGTHLPSDCLFLRLQIGSAEKIHLVLFLVSSPVRPEEREWYLSWAGCYSLVLRCSVAKRVVLTGRSSYDASTRNRKFTTIYKIIMKQRLMIKRESEHELTDIMWALSLMFKSVLRRRRFLSIQE